MKTIAPSRRIEREVLQKEIKFLAYYLGGQNMISKLLNVHRSSVSRWAKIQASPSQASKIAILRAVIGRLLEVYKPDTALKWLGSMNAHLADRRPIDMIRLGKFSDVLTAIEQDDTLSFV